MTQTFHTAPVAPSSPVHASAAGLRVPRRHTRPGIDPLDEVRWEKRRTVIANPDGSVVFQMDDVEVPAGWSQLATDIVVSKYFRKAGVPGARGHEASVRQVVRRIARTIRRDGEAQGGYFATPEDADAFEAELSYLLVHQVGAFNSPVWFNCGLYHEYGLAGSGGNFYYDPATRTVQTTQDSYSRPQVSACFIQSVDDDLMSIFELARNEARVYKFGSGTGTNFSKLRGRMEKLSGGGTSSGLMSFLEVLDKGAGATKSGGTTRRAAKMVVLDMDHPEIVDFIRWKVREEKKVAALVASGYSSDFNGEAYGTVSGQNSNNSVRVPDRFMDAVVNDGPWQTTLRTSGQVHETLRARELWREVAESAWKCADPGVQFDDTIQRWHTCKATDRIHATNPCVTGDTMVATSDGWRRIDSLVDTSARIIGADGKPHWVTRIIPTGRKQVFRLRTRAGFEVRITGDHKVWTKERGDVPVTELRPGDALRLLGAGFGQDRLPEKAVTALGMQIAWAHADAPVLSGAMSASHTDPRLETLAPGWPAQADFAAATGLEAALLRRDGLGHIACFTEAVFGLDRNSVAALLRGFFCQSRGEGTMLLSPMVSSRKLAIQVQQLLLGFDIKARIDDAPPRPYRGPILDSLAFTTVVEPADGFYRLEIAKNLRDPSGLVFEREIDLRGKPPEPETSPSPGLKQALEAHRHALSDSVASIEPLGEEDVFDLTEPDTHHFVANGLVVHNCSEFVFLDNTACNLASVNLMKFMRPDGTFDIDGYRHANRVFFLAQEILVGLASYPTETIAKRSCEFRPLGLGYANLGTLLMMQGLPYDSEGARAYAATITALMTGEAYALSAEMAASKGPFDGFLVNRESMMDVMRMHREAARNIDASLAPRDLRAAAIECWDRAVALGGLHGYRNAQATVLAPTGTIGLLMDCDTTGVEPDFALVKFKKLAGGGYFKIVNQSVPGALRRLGYDDPSIERITRHALGTGTLEDAPHINRASLRERGLTGPEIDRIEQTLPSMLDVRFAFVRGVLGDDTLTRLGVSMAEREKPTFNALEYLGLTDSQIAEANAIVCGSLTVEGAPGLGPSHLPVFDCANRCGPSGTRYIQPMGHIRMMAAVQPFISGAISKTVNLPQDATVKDVEQIYFESWRAGIKAVALYRDGSKLSQPLATGKKTEESAAPVHPKLRRRRLPKRRHGFTQESRISGHKVFLRTGEYEDGTVGEIFIDMHKEGAAFRSMMNCFAISVSMGLQYGVPLNDLVDQFTFTRFEPHGRVEGHDNIRLCTSVVDYVFRVLGLEYLDRTDLAQVKPEELGMVRSLEHATGRPVGFEHHRGPNGNGHGKKGGHEAPAAHTASPAPAVAPNVAAGRRSGVAVESGSDAMLGKFPGDAPLCDQCGHITIRNGTCYKCLNCGNSMGCS